MSFLFGMGSEDFIIVGIIIILIDKVFDEVRHRHSQKGSVSEEFDAVHLIDIDAGSLTGFIGAVRVKNGEEVAELFASTVDTDQFFCFGVKDLPDLFLFSFASWIIDKEYAFAWAFEESPAGDIADEFGSVCIIDTADTAFQFFTVGGKCDLGHMLLLGTDKKKDGFLSYRLRQTYPLQSASRRRLVTNIILYLVVIMTVSVKYMILITAYML